MWRWPRRLGAVTCYFYWTKSGNYLITSNYTVCAELVRLLEVRARLYGPPWTPRVCSVGIPGTPFLPKVPEKQVTRQRGCGPSERPGPWGVPPLGSASESEMGWFKARPAPLGLPGSPYLTSGEIGELIPQVGGVRVPARARFCLGIYSSNLPPPSPYPPPSGPSPHPSAAGPWSLKLGQECVLWGEFPRLARLGRGLLVQSRTRPARAHRPQRSVSVVPLACGLTW